MVKRRLISFSILNGDINLENSFFTPVTYRGPGTEQHLIFFSGGGIVSKGVCGDVFVHDIIMGKNNRGFNIIFVSNFKLTGINSPLSDYAAFLTTNF
jgi:hypothetical protein